MRQQRAVTADSRARGCPVYAGDTSKMMGMLHTSPLDQSHTPHHGVEVGAAHEAVQRREDAVRRG